MGASVLDPTTSPEPAPSAIRNGLMDKYEQLIQSYWDENPDLYHIVQLKKQKVVAANVLTDKATTSEHYIDGDTITEDRSERISNAILRGANLRARIRESHDEIRERSLALNSDIIPRTQAHNRKCGYQSRASPRLAMIRTSTVQGRPL